MVLFFFFFFVFFFTLFNHLYLELVGERKHKKTIRQTYSSNQRSGLQSKIKKKKKISKTKNRAGSNTTEKRHRSRVPTRSEPYICLYNELTTSSLLPQQYTIKIINKKQFFGFFTTPPPNMPTYSYGSCLNSWLYVSLCWSLSDLYLPYYVCTRKIYSVERWCQ